jgi:signal transduction histidine kinase
VSQSQRIRHLEMLADVSERMVTSLSPAETLQSVAEAVVPSFADWCVVDLATSSPWLMMVARSHVEPEKVKLIEELRRSYPPGERTNPRHAIYRAVEERATIREDVRDEDLVARAVDAEHLRLLRALGIGSHIVVPLVARGRVVGAVSFVRAPDRDRFDDSEVLTAEGIARRTALATDNAQLYRDAQDAIQLRDRFLAVASHELRNPLMVVRGHWELLERRIEPHLAALDPDDVERIRKSLTRLGQGIDQLRRLIDDLLDVDRLRHGVVQLERTNVDLVQLVRESVEELPGEAASRVNVTLADGPMVGQWDVARLRQVIDNMLGNALKYSPSESQVIVELTDTPRSVRLSVTDAGIGISPDRLDSIFEPFSRAPNASSMNYPGLGLGLAISREIVGQLGGRMWATSDGEGTGSTFTIELDRASG